MLGTTRDTRYSPIDSMASTVPSWYAEFSQLGTKRRGTAVSSAIPHLTVSPWSSDQCHDYGGRWRNMALFQRGEIWWYEFNFARRRIRESAKTRSKTVAKQAEKNRRRELENGFN